VPSSIVLSRDDYDHFFQKRPALALLLEGLLLNQTFFFVGYSLRDPDFRQIHSRISLMLEEARRPAFATTFDPHGPHALAQWKRKQVELVGLEPGGDRQMTLAAWLDALAERVLDAPPLLLAPDAEPELPPALIGLRDALLSAGEELQKLSRAASGPAEARELSRVLGALVDLGWRPRTRGPLWLLWLDLATRLPDPADRRRLLADALAHTERYADVEGLNELLERLGDGRSW
jgi:hypothetical protein